MNAMKLVSGIRLLGEREGTGAPAKKGERAVFNLRLFLNQGEEVPLNAKQAEHLPKERLRMKRASSSSITRSCLDGGKRLPAVERAVLGMRAGGYRKVCISPHLAYRGKGIPELIPPDAVLVCEIWLRHLAEKEAP